MLAGVPGKAATPPKKTPDLLTQGKKLYEQNCSPCHGTNGDGKGPAGVALKPPPNDFANPFKDWPHTKGDPNKIFEVISKGIPNSAMVKWDQLPETGPVGTRLYRDGILGFHETATEEEIEGSFAMGITPSRPLRVGSSKYFHRALSG